MVKKMCNSCEVISGVTWTHFIYIYIYIYIKWITFFFGGFMDDKHNRSQVPNQEILEEYLFFPSNHA